MDMDWNLFYIPSRSGLLMLLVLNVGAVYRISRLIARDSITDGMRDRIQAKYHGMLVNLLLCMWCLSFWIAIIASFLTLWDTTREAWLVVAAVLTIATAVGLLSERS